jgi:hypothetical protein
MGARGPVPKETSSTRHRPKQKSRTLEAGTVEPPKLLGSFSDPTRAWWAAWLDSPQAPLFAATDWQALLRGAYLVEAFYDASRARSSRPRSGRSSRRSGDARRPRPARLKFAGAQAAPDEAKPERQPRARPPARREALSDARLIVPALDDEPWPTLGPQVCDWIETYMVHGPGDLLGQPVEALRRGSPLHLPRLRGLPARARARRAGAASSASSYRAARAFGKTEIAAWIAIAELDPTAPVRCDGWRVERGEWVPVGRAVPTRTSRWSRSPRSRPRTSPTARCTRSSSACRSPTTTTSGSSASPTRNSPGKIQPLAAAPSARDGARTTFQHFDETHLFVEQRLKGRTRRCSATSRSATIADPWSLETTTMYGPGEGSVAEDAHEYALAVLAGEINDPGSTSTTGRRPSARPHDEARLARCDPRGVRRRVGVADVDAIEALYRDPKRPTRTSSAATG